MQLLNWDLTETDWAPVCHCRDRPTAAPLRPPHRTAHPSTLGKYFGWQENILIFSSNWPNVQSSFLVQPCGLFQQSDLTPPWWGEAGEKTLWLRAGAVDWAESLSAALLDLLTTVRSPPSVFSGRRVQPSSQSYHIPSRSSILDPFLSYHIFKFIHLCITLKFNHVRLDNICWFYKAIINFWKTACYDKIPTGWPQKDIELYCVTLERKIYYSAIWPIIHNL